MRVVTLVAIAAASFVPSLGGGVGRRQPHRDERARHKSWLSRIPAPSKPAPLTSWSSRISSGIGAEPGIRSET